MTIDAVKLVRPLRRFRSRAAISSRPGTARPRRSRHRRRFRPGQFLVLQPRRDRSAGSTISGRRKRRRSLCASRAARSSTSRSTSGAARRPSAATSRRGSPPRAANSSSSRPASRTVSARLSRILRLPTRYRTSTRAEHDAGILWNDPDTRDRMAAWRTRAGPVGKGPRPAPGSPTLLQGSEHELRQRRRREPRRVDAHIGHRRGGIHRKRGYPPADRADRPPRPQHRQADLRRLDGIACGGRGEPALRLSRHRHLRCARRWRRRFATSAPTR